MSPSSSPLARPYSAIVARALTFLACASAAVVAVQEQSAARMLLWPWQLLYWLGPLAAGGALIAMLLDRDPAARPLTRPWIWSLVVTAIVLVGSTLLSPVRDQILPWVAWPLTLLALSAVVGRLLSHQEAGAALRRHTLVALGAVGAILSITSLVMLVSDVGFAAALRADTPFPLADPLRALITGRNSQPLGHVNYTAGSALLFFPALAALAWNSRGLRRAAWGLATVACLGMFFSGGSRGGFLGLAAALGLTLIVVWRTRMLPRWLLCSVLVVVLGAAWMHPAIQGRLLPPSPDAPINVSNEQRKTWLIGGYLATADRPLLGWGTGSTPWVFPYYRNEFDYGPPSILQLHSLPVQLLAEGGVALGLSAAALAVLTTLAIARRLRRLSRHSLDADGAVFWAAATGLLGYGVFSVTDYQLDLPIISAALAVLLGVVVASDADDAPLAPASASRTHGLPARVMSGTVAAAILALTWLAWHELRLREAMERDDWPAAARIAPQNAALRIYVADRLIKAAPEHPAQAAQLRAEALRLLRLNHEAKLAQELSHTMAGWLLLPDDPTEAHAQFQSALVVYPNSLSPLFGSGLASLAEGNFERAVAELTATCLAHPRFIASSWWQDERLLLLRPQVHARLKTTLALLADSAALRSDERAHAAYLHALLEWIEETPGALERVHANAPGHTRLFWTMLADPPPRLPTGMPAGLAAALAPASADPLAAPPWISIIEIAQKSPVSGGYDRERELVAQTPPADLIHAALAGRPDSPWPYYSTMNSRVGFPINHRQPRLVGINDGYVAKNNIWASHLLGSLWPDEYWIPHRHILNPDSPPR